MKIRIWHIIVFVVLLAAFAVAGAPAAIVASFTNGQFKYQRAHGTIWNARYEGVELGQYDVDTLTWRISPLDLIQGKVIVPMHLAGDIEGDAILAANREGDRRLQAPNLRISGLQLDGLALPGETQVQGLDIFFDHGVCQTAQGQITSDVLVRSSQALRISGPQLAGQAVCNDNDALITLSGQNPGGPSMVATVRLRGDGRGEWRLGVQGASAEVQTALSVGGFQLDSATGELVRREELTWFPF